MKKQFAEYELKDGTTHKVRIKFATKRAIEKAAKANRWSEDKDGVTMGAFLAFHASKAEGQHDLRFEEFLEQLEDLETWEDDQDDTETDPTQTAATTD